MKPNKKLEQQVTKVRNWLLSKGFVECYNNHPNSSIREFHFIKDLVTVVCVFDNCPYYYMTTWNPKLGIEMRSLRSTFLNRSMIITHKKLVNLLDLFNSIEKMKFRK